MRENGNFLYWIESLIGFTDVLGSIVLKMQNELSKVHLCEQLIK